MTEVHTWKWWRWWSSKIARLLLAPALMIFTQFNRLQVAQLLCRVRAPLCGVTGNMLACCNIRSRDPTLHTYWWSVPGCNEMMMTTEWSLRSHWTVDSAVFTLTIPRHSRQVRSQSVRWHFICHTHWATLSSQSLQWGFSLVYLHNIESSCSPWTYIAQTLNFLCVPQTPLRIWDRRQFAIGGYLIWRTEAGEYVFISSIANQVLEDEQRICTWNQYTAKGLAFWLVMKNVSTTLIGQSWIWVQQTEWFLTERQIDKGWEPLI